MPKLLKLKDLKSKRLEIDVPTHLECLWVSIRPNWLPRSFSIIIVCAVYYPGSTSIYAPPQEDLILHITATIQNLTSKFSNPLFIVAGDFNGLQTNEICDACNLKQVVKTKTRKNATLDLILTNIDNNLYLEPKSLPKIGGGDHFCLLYKPKNYEIPKIETKKVLMRKFPNSSVQKFGNWITKFQWDSEFEINNVNKKNEFFESLLWQNIDNCFPLKPVKIANTDKEWMTPYIKDLVTQSTL